MKIAVHTSLFAKKHQYFMKITPRQLTTDELNRRQLTTDVVIFHRQLTAAELQT